MIKRLSIIVATLLILTKCHERRAYCHLSDFWVLHNNVESGFVIDSNLPYDDTKINLDKIYLSKDRKVVFCKNETSYLNVEYYFIDLALPKYIVVREDSVVTIDDQLLPIAKLPFIEARDILSKCDNL
jgi:hypothetical protein